MFSLPPVDSTDLSSASSKKTSAEDFWKREFQSIPDLLDLPTDFPRRAERTFAGSICFEQLPLELTRDVSKAGASQGCALFVTLLAAWQILLSRLSGQREPVSLIHASTQSQRENSSLVGYCVHLLPIRSQLEWDESAAAFLRRVRQSVLNAYDHQEITYDLLLHAVGASAQAGRLPLSEVQFNLEPVAQEANFTGLATRVEAHRRQLVNFDLFLNIVESRDGLRLECGYNADLYRESTIRRWLGHYRTLLEAIAADVTASVAELPLLNESLRNALLVQRNNTVEAYPGESSIPDLIRKQAQDSPDAVAVDFYGKKLTRRQLEEHSDRIAAAIHACNIGRGNLVGIYVERSVEMVVALLGVLKSGAGYVPLDPLYSKERIQDILQATQMSLLLTLDSHLPELPATAIPALSIDRAMKTPASSAAPQDRPTADSTAYVIFTSGSTGTPKGVEITHRSVVNLLHAATKEIGLRPNDRLLAVTTLTFDIAALELLLPLVYGGTLVVARRQDSWDGARLLELIKTSLSNVLQATPITWRMLLEAGFSSWPGFKMLCGGEVWNRELANHLLSGGGRLWNMYGPTETTIWSSISEVTSGNEPILIGPPLANTQFYVLDERMQPVPPGVTGELYIGGDGLARGYYNNPELTSAMFLRNPFFETTGARIYKTGDLVRQSEDGDIEFLRRSDHQIKLRGFRIEPGEIEKAIETCSGLKQAAVVLRQNQIGDPALIAYLVPQQKTGFDTEALRRALFARLPEYMVPSWFVVLKEFPLTSNGKVDRKALPSPAWQDAGLHLHSPEMVRTSASSLICASVRPRTGLECAMLGIWQEIFRNDAIGIRDNFFDLGGNSLTLARIRAQLKKVTDQQMSAADVFAAPTVEALAHRLESSQDRLFQSRVIPLRAEGTQPPLFLISQSMVFRRMVQWLSPDQPVFTVVMQDEDLKNGVHTTFQEIAAYYVSLIRAVRPTGPYRLGGWCISAWLAYEIAQQLRRAGEAVDLLLLVDAWAPGYWRKTGRMRRFSAEANYHVSRVWRYWSAFHLLSAAEKLSFLAKRSGMMRAAAAGQIRTILYRAGIRIAMKAESQTPLIDQVLYAASEGYEEREGKFEALVFCSDEQPRGKFLPTDLGWSELLQQEVEAICLPGNHSQIFDDPGARILADKIASRLSLQPIFIAEAGGQTLPQVSEPQREKSKQPNACALANN